MNNLFKKVKESKKLLVLATLSIIMIAIYFMYFQSLTFSTTTEQSQMEQLASFKEVTPIAEFITDGCSGGISTNWSEAVANYKTVISTLNSSYATVETLPFESVCVEHDRKYHLGAGGYVGRLRADNALRSGIIAYGIDNAIDIQERANLQSPEQAIYLYETIAEAVYRGVRLGGAPCTGEPYAWGYGYGGGVCE